MVARFRTNARSEYDAVRQQLRRNRKIRKSQATAGYVNPSSGGGSLGPLHTQSVEATLRSLIYDRDELSLLPDLHVTNVDQTVHEMPVQRAYGKGRHNRPFMSEGGVGRLQRGLYEKVIAQIKLMSTRFEVTDVASQIGLSTGETALARETASAILSFLGQIESAIFHAREDLSSLQFDGLIPQIVNVADPKSASFDSDYKRSYFDARGKRIGMDLLMMASAELYREPFFGKPNISYCPPQVLSDIAVSQNDKGRWTQTAEAVPRKQYTFSVNPNGIVVHTPRGSMLLKSAPFIQDQHYAPTGADGEAGKTPVAPNIGSILNAPDATSQFNTPADAGAYRYRVVAVNNDGHSAPVDAPVVNVASGDHVEIVIDDVAAKASGPTAPLYYQIFRSEVGAANANDALLVAEIPVNNLGAGGETEYIDRHERIYGTGRILMCDNTVRTMQIVQLLDMVRRPLAQVASSQPFMLMQFATPIIMQIGQCMVIDNVPMPSEKLSDFHLT